MSKAELIIEFSKAKHQTTLYPGDLSGRTYWEGVQSAYQNILSKTYSDWANKGLGKAVWMAPAEGILEVFPTLLSEGY